VRLADLVQYVREFRWHQRATVEDITMAPRPGGGTIEVPTYVNEFWTSRQRAAHSLHEVSYRACFKPQLPRFFIDRLTDPGDVVYDPFAGRGTTPLEAALAGRVPVASDANPLSAVLLTPRLAPQTTGEVHARLEAIDLGRNEEAPDGLLTFFHAETLRAIASLRAYLLERTASGTLDALDRWIRMVAVNRLTGHSPGFFSVYTLPPNQATSVQAQQKINLDRQQVPPRRDIAALIVRKTMALLKDCDAPTREVLARVGPAATVVTGLAHDVPAVPSASVDLVVTSPPFLNVVDYKGDNWLRCWFCGINPDDVSLTTPHRLDAWQAAMTRVFHELRRVLKPGGCVAFEVGEVRKGAIRLEEAVIPAGLAAGLAPACVLINAQQFTKTAAVWGVDNNRLGTNTNRIVVFRKT
jgi:hypothetical protein